MAEDIVSTTNTAPSNKPCRSCSMSATYGAQLLQRLPHSAQPPEEVVLDFGFNLIEPQSPGRPAADAL